MKRLKTVSSRMRPLLGTFVSVSVQGALTNSAREEAFAGAFHRIEEIQNLMSYFFEASDVSKINRTAINQWVAVHPLTVYVLSQALGFQKNSEGIFNVALAQQPLKDEFSKTLFRKNKFLAGFQRPSDCMGGYAPCFEIRGAKVTRLCSKKIDLGGIAKGFAVDQACRFLVKEYPEVSGVINAGGDLRAFGNDPAEISIRVPAENNKRDKSYASYNLKIKNGAVATSTLQEKHVHSFRNIKLSGLTATVFAGDCMTADALTKIVLMAGEETTSKCLSFYGARSFSFDKMARPLRASDSGVNVETA